VAFFVRGARAGLMRDGNPVPEIAEEDVRDVSELPEPEAVEAAVRRGARVLLVGTAGLRGVSEVRGTLVRLSGGR
jgi:hypothetical protein